MVLTSKFTAEMFFTLMLASSLGSWASGQALNACEISNVLENQKTTPFDEAAKQRQKDNQAQARTLNFLAQAGLSDVSTAQARQGDVSPTQANKTQEKQKQELPEEFEPLRTEFFQCIVRAAERKLSEPAAQENARKGIKLAIRLTSDPALYAAERSSKKRGYILEDFARHATSFLLQDCSKEDLPLFDTLLRAEEKAVLVTEPSYSCSCFELGKYYLRREPKAKGETLFDKGMARVNKASYEATNSIIPEWFANYLRFYEDYLEAKHSPKSRKVYEMRVQQRARQYNNVGNKYLDGVYGPPAKTGLREYEVKKAIEVYTQAIDLIPTWKEPYKGRAKAYKLLGQNKEAEEDLKKAK